VNPPLWVLASASFSVGAGMRLIDPLLPMLAREFGVGLGAVAPLIGGFALAYGLGQLGLTPLGDRLGKLRVAAATLGLYALTLLACTLAGDLATLLALRVAAGLVAAAVIPLIMAHIGDSVPYDRRQATLGRFLTGMVMAQLLAGPISGVVADHLGWRASFLGFGLMAAAVTALFMARLGPAMLRAPAGAARGGGLAGFRRLLAERRGRRLLLAAAGDGMLLFGGAIPFIASFLIEDFRLSAGEAGLVAASFGLGSLVYTRSAPWLVRRLGEGGLVLCGGVGLCAGLALIAAAPGWWTVAPATATLGFTFFLLHGVLQARATEALPEARGTAMAVFSMSIFLGQAVGAVIFGTLIVEAGFRPAFLLSAAGVLLLAVWIRLRVIPAA
jgi:predicted MFS family arabinose efflux permease